MEAHYILEKLTIVCVALQSFELFGCKFSNDALGLCVCVCACFQNCKNWLPNIYSRDYPSSALVLVALPMYLSMVIKGHVSCGYSYQGFSSPCARPMLPAHEKKSGETSKSSSRKITWVEDLLERVWNKGPEWWTLMTIRPSDSTDCDLMTNLKIVLDKTDGSKQFGNPVMVVKRINTFRWPRATGPSVKNWSKCSFISPTGPQGPWNG